VLEWSVLGWSALGRPLSGAGAGDL